MDAILARALELADFHEQARTVRRRERIRTHVARGIGFATFMHGAGFTGSGEDISPRS